MVPDTTPTHEVLVPATSLLLASFKSKTKSVPVSVAQPVVVLTDIVDAPTDLELVKYAFSGRVPDVADLNMSVLEAAMAVPSLSY